IWSTPLFAAASSPALAEDSDAARARAALGQWLQLRLGPLAAGFTIDDGSGLSREARVSAHALGALLQWAWRSPAMPELVSSLPLVGVDGTLRRSTAAPGRAHLKTGSMRDVAAVAGYVLSDSGRRYVLVALLNDPNAPHAHAVLDAAIDWVAHDPQHATP
ncbi:MAG TPA: D-alanyl-D-alanine carboxypeptidase, partial [Burkholderiaceae bacterium]